jgi:hypothetical protein
LPVIYTLPFPAFRFVYHTTGGGAMKRLLVVSVILVSAFGTPVLAAEQPFQQGTWELSLTSEFDPIFDPSVGYYVVDNLAITVDASYGKTESEVSSAKDTSTTQAVGVGFDVNIPTGTIVVPLISFGVQYFGTEEDDGVDVIELSGPAMTVGGGLRLLVGERSSVNLGVAYSKGTLESTLNGTPGADVDVTDLAGFVGYSLYFR